jgi:WD40 repeat protein
VPRDLEAVALKCLEKEPGGRYPLALELADDLRRFLDHRPVKARGTSAAGRLRRWARRNRGVTAALGVIDLLLIGGAIASTLAALYFQRLAGERESARTAAESAAAEAGRRGDAERWQYYRANMAAAAMALQLPNTGAARRALAAAPKEYRGWEWLHFNARLDEARAILRMPGVLHAANFRPGGMFRQALAFSRDGKRIASGSPEPGTVGVWDTATAREAGVLPGQRHYLQDLAFGPDDRLLALTNDGTLLSWELSRDDRTILCRIPTQSLNGLLLSPDGRLLLGVQGKQARLWDVTAGRKRASLPGESVRDDTRMAVFSSDGRHLAYSTDDAAIHLWDVQAGAEARVLRGHSAYVRTLAFSPDGKCLASGASFPDNSARLWSVPDSEKIAVLDGHQNEVNWVAFSLDGSRLVSGSMDKTARLWDAISGKLLSVLKGHNGIVRSAIFSPDGRRLASVSNDALVRLWNAATGEPFAVLSGHTGAVGGSFSARTAPCWRRRPRTRRCGCGTWANLSGTAYSPGTPATCTTSPSAPTAGLGRHGTPLGHEHRPGNRSIPARRPAGRPNRRRRLLQPGRPAGRLGHGFRRGVCLGCRHANEGANPPSAARGRRAGVSEGGLPAQREVSGREGW